MARGCAHTQKYKTKLSRRKNENCTFLGRSPCLSTCSSTMKKCCKGMWSESSIRPYLSEVSISSLTISLEMLSRLLRSTAAGSRAETHEEFQREGALGPRGQGSWTGRAQSATGPTRRQRDAALLSMLRSMGPGSGSSGEGVEKAGDRLGLAPGSSLSSSRPSWSSSLRHSHSPSTDTRKLHR